MLESPGRGGMAFFSSALKPESIIFSLRLRSAILETSKSRGLNSEVHVKTNATAAQTPNCLSEPLALRIKPLEFKNEA
jgi:hypothetical protein